MNENGRQAINDILSEANISGFYRQPRLDPGLILSLPRNDVIVTSACVAFWKYDNVEDFVWQLKEHFGDHFFLEVQYHNTNDQKTLNQRILRLRDQAKIPIIMGCDSHYIDEDGALLRTDFLFSKGMEYPDEKGWYMDYPDGDEAYRRFEEQGILTPSQIDEAMSNTEVFLGVEEYDCPCFNQEIKCPTLYPGYTQEQKDEEYKKLVYLGWDKYKLSVPVSEWDHYEEEIEKEVQTVIDTHTADYFIDDYYIIEQGKKNGGVITSTGRGSGVSFFTNKLLGFTEVDRISAAVKMYPERFMSTTRILEAKTLPDLDINVADQEPFARAQQQILGEDHAYPMIAYHTYKASAAWKLYAKSQNIDFETANKVSAQIKRYEEVVKLSDDDERDNIDIYDYVAPEFREIFERSKMYQSIIDSWSIAPCSYLLYQGSIRKEIGLIRAKDNLCCLMDGHWAEDYKFLKNDLLKVKVVDLIDRVFKRIGMPRLTVEELLKRCSPEDKVWDIYRKSCTIGVNQVEQPGTSARVSKFSPTNISELCAFVAAIRPGFKSMYKKFEGREPFSYNIKSLDDLIQTPQFPQSYMLYQEMAMEVLNYAGIDMGECYTIIKDIAKKRAENVIAYKDRFLSGMSSRLIENEGLLENEAYEVAKDIWQILEDSSRYSFNACLAGDTRFYSKGNDQKNRYTIEELYYIANVPKNKTSYANRNAYKTFHKKGYGKGYSQFYDKKLYVNDVLSIFPAMPDVVYRVATENGCWVKCTNDHRLMTPNGLKKLSELRPGSLLVTVSEEEGEEKTRNRLDFWTEESPIISIDKLDEQRVYDVVMLAPAHNFLTEGGIIVGNSHSYCVAIDSLYGAWLKTYYPLEFYECYLRIQEESGDKDKMNAAKEEAEKYFKIHFLPFRFGQDNRAITADSKTKSITSSLSSIKGISNKIGELLYDISQKKHDGFMDLLIDMDNSKVGCSNIEKLIKIDYFADFGNSRKLLKIFQVYSESFKRGTIKTISRDAEPELLERIKPFLDSGLRKGGEPAARYKIVDMTGLLKTVGSFIESMDIEDFDIKVKIQAQKEILGYFVPTGNECDRPLLYVEDVKPLVRKSDKKQFGYSYFCKSLGSGIQNRFTVVNSVIEKCGKVSPNSIILCTKKPSINHGFFRMEDYQLIQ